MQVFRAWGNCLISFLTENPLSSTLYIKRKKPSPPAHRVGPLQAFLYIPSHEAIHGEKIRVWIRQFLSLPNL